MAASRMSTDCSQFSMKVKVKGRFSSQKVAELHFKQYVLNTSHT